MSFISYGTYHEEAGPILRRAILANSLAIAPGDAVRYNAGLFDAASSTVVVGHVSGIQTFEGLPIFDGQTTPQSVTTGASNATTTKLMAIVDVSKMSVWTGDVNGTVGTTTNSDKVGTHINLVSQTQLAETSGGAASGEYSVYEKISSTKLAVSIAASQIFN